jgi:hypothetical protein
LSRASALWSSKTSLQELYEVRHLECQADSGACTPPGAGVHGGLGALSHACIHSLDVGWNNLKFVAITAGIFFFMVNSYKKDGLFPGKKHL